MEMERACCENSCFASRIQHFYGRDEMSRGANGSLVAWMKAKAEVFTARPPLHKDGSANIDNGGMHSSHRAVIQIL